MGDQRLAAVEPDEQVFRPPRQRLDPLAREPLAKAGRKGKADVGRASVRPLRSARRPSRARAPAGPSRPRAVQASVSCRLTGMIPDHRQEGRPVFLQLDLADAVERSEFVERVRPLLRHLDQRPVGKNDIGRLLLRRGDRAAQALQRREQRSVGVARLDESALAPLRPGADDVLAQREGRLRRAGRAGPPRSRPAGRGPPRRGRSASPTAIASARRASRRACGPCPTPKVFSWSCPCRSIASVVFPARMLARWPKKKRPDVRSTADSAFCASIRPSIRRTAPWQTSQWPQRPDLLAEHGEQRLAPASRRLAQARRDRRASPSRRACAPPARRFRRSGGGAARCRPHRRG